MASTAKWTENDTDHEKEAREKLGIWPLDEHNVKLLNEVHPRGFVTSRDDAPHPEYDLIAIGSGAGGLVSSKQTARRGGKSAMISEALAGGDCLNSGCVPSKALIRSARAVSQIRRASGVGIDVRGEIVVDFPRIMARLRQKRATIAPADGHPGTEETGAHVYQGRGRLTGPNTLEVNGQTLTFKNCVLATGGRPAVPDGIPGLNEAPFTTNEHLFNLEELPPRMVVLGAGVVALEMAQAFSLLGTKVTVVNRSSRLFESKSGDPEAAAIIQTELEKDGVEFLSSSAIEKVETLKDGREGLPIMKVAVGGRELGCECLLVAAGRMANVENCGLEEGGVEFEVGKGVVVDDHARSVSNPSVFAVGDCCSGVPRLTHMAGEMAKLAVQNSLADDDWKLSSLVVPSVAYTEPELATVGISSEDQAQREGIECEVYRTGLEHNDRALLENNNVGFVKIIVKKGTDEIIGATIVAERAGEMVNEVTLAMKNNLGLYAIGRNIHSYPTTGEAVMGCGLQYVNKHLPRFD
eukprot:CAMPEP_0201122344 /NCGR_PEP_ID=MMETSP0850-20130426/6009_1 /ASSEMBLY_ACC=CAM_ASM_000622 /TAXON_ID=183588 /ORGANISM="Pseudo-nitzschia fraudulenta, Strain WWA7" /LENGTH=522 /DNA_ID=CAMNT_0047389013 /DNA_START=213 /DNA_END=1781 /DNA_ORIENTATION=-